MHCLALGTSVFAAQPNAIHVYADLPVMHASRALLSTILSVPYNEIDHTMALFELTCPLDSLGSTRDRKQLKGNKYLWVTSELDHLILLRSVFWVTYHVHCQLCVKSIQLQNQYKKLLNGAAEISISGKIFLAKEGCD